MSVLVDCAPKTKQPLRSLNCRLRYRLTLLDLSEILARRGIEVSHEAVRSWETKLLPSGGGCVSRLLPLRPLLDRLRGHVTG